MGSALTFKLGPFPVRIELAFVIVTVVIGAIVDRRPPEIVAWAVLVFASVLIHELGHAVAFRSFGGAASIRLWAGGGLTTGPATSPKRRIVISLAGPATGIAVGMVVLLLAGYPPDTVTFWHAVTRDAVWINLVWAGFNLLPTLPLDGGNILAAVLNLATKGSGRRLAHYISIVVLGVAAVGSALLEQLFVALFCIYLAAMNLRMLRNLEGADLYRVLRNGLDALDVQQFESARDAAATVLSSRNVDPGIRGAAVELQAWVDLAEGRADAATGRLAAFPGGQSVNAFLRSALGMAAGGPPDAAAFVTSLLSCTEPSLLGIGVGLAMQHYDVFSIGSAIDDLPVAQAQRAISAFEVGLHGAGYFDLAGELGAHLFMLTDNPQSAYNAACSFARAGDRAGAIMWLRAALARGIDPHRIELEPQLAGLRGIPEFDQLRPT